MRFLESFLSKNFSIMLGIGLVVYTTCLRAFAASLVGI
jgi:hypothetical protein